VTVEIELLVLPDCPNEAVAGELIRTAVADTGVKGAQAGGRGLNRASERPYDDQLVSAPSWDMNPRLSQ
jgi:hypothetical protein